MGACASTHARSRTHAHAYAHTGPPTWPPVAAGTLPSATRCGRMARAQRVTAAAWASRASTARSGSPWRTCLAARATAHSVATERPAASTCPLPADFTFFLVTPLLEAAILYGLIGESCSGTHGPKPWTGGRGPGAGGWGRRGLAGAGNLGEAAPAARWGPQVFQEASG